MYRSALMRSVMSAVVCAALALTAPVSPIRAEDGTLPVADPCNPVGLTACALPFPSDLFTIPDASSPTGRRVDVSDEIVTTAYREAVPLTALPEATLDGATGFSVSTPVLFELDAWPDPASLPADGGTAFVVFDMTTGSRTPVRVEIDADAARAAEPSAVVRAWPATRFEHGHRYVAAVTRSLRRRDGTAFKPSAGFREAIGGGDSSLAQHYTGIVEFLAAHGIETTRLLSATDFTIRDETDAQGDMLEAVAIASESPHPVRVDAVRAAEKPPGAVTVYGRVSLTNFQAEDGSFDPGSGGQTYWTTFQLLVPPSVQVSPAPVAIFGHGFGGNKTRMIEMSVQNAEHGIATIAIDWSYRGTRVLQDGGYILSLNRPSKQAEFIGMFLQGMVDVASLRAALARELAELDVLPRTTSSRDGLARSGDGVSDLRGDHVVYQGTSYGGILGVGILAVVPGLEGGILHVCGLGVMDAFTHLPSWLWHILDGIVPHGGSGTDTSIGIALMQHAVDPAEGANYAHRLRAPLGGGPARPVLLQYGEGDAWVRNVTSEALIAVAELPQVSWADDGTISLTDGYGWQMVTNPGNIPEFLWGFAAHAFTASLPAGRAVADVWLSEYASGLG